MLEVKELQYFVVCADLSSFSRAAEVLYTTQPNVSKVIRSLEEKLGFEVFERDNRGIKLTRRGRQAYEYAGKILEQERQLAQIYKIDDREEFSISSNPSSWVARCFTDFIRQHIADAGAPAAGGLQRPALTQPAGAAPLVQPCALHHTAKGQIHHLAGKAVADAPAALACIHELPLLPRMACIAPQLDGRAILGVEVLYFQHLSIGGFDDIKFIFQNDCLRCLCHRARLLSSLVALL